MRRSWTASAQREGGGSFAYSHSIAQGSCSHCLHYLLTVSNCHDSLWTKISHIGLIFCCGRDKHCPKCCFPILSSSPCVMQNKQTSKKRQTKKNQELERHSSKSDQRNKIPLIASADDVLVMKDCLVSVMTIWHLPDTAHAVDPRIFYWHIFKLQWKSVEIALGGFFPSHSEVLLKVTVGNYVLIQSSVIRCTYCRAFLWITLGIYHVSLPLLCILPLHLLLSVQMNKESSRYS